MTPDPLQQAIAHHQAGRLREAETLYRQILATQPNHADALNLFGVLAAQAGQLGPGIQLVQQSIAIQPTASAYNNLGNILRFMGKPDEAIEAYRATLQMAPNDAKAHANLGTVLRQIGRHDEAISAFEAALKIDPNLIDAHTSLGNALREKGRFNDAIASSQRAVTIDPNFAEGYSNLGNALSDAGRLGEAIIAFERSVQLKPTYAEGFVNLSRAQRDVGNLELAVAAGFTAAQLRPDLAEAQISLGNALMQQGRMDEGIAAYRKAINLQPTLYPAHSNLLMALHSRVHNPAEMFAEHQRWAQMHAASLSRQITPHENDRTPDRRLRIGYVSADFRRHPVGRFLLPVLANHDRERFELVCYSGVTSPDDITEQIRARADSWHDVAYKSDHDLAAMIRQHRIDILIDLAGHTSGGRLLTFARKPAPVQVTWLGYPDTTGLDTIDYRITDAIADPPGASDMLHSEKLIRLEGGFLCYQFGSVFPPIAPAERASSEIVFGCFNNFTKCSPQVMNMWGRILDRVPGARLLLKSRGLDDPPTIQRVHAMLQTNDIDPARVELLGQVPSAESHLARYNRVDIALDTWPYNGTTTTCEALPMGVPVITLRGDTHVSRVSASLLTAAGLDRWIANDADGYVELAEQLARAGPRSLDDRQVLRQQLLASSVCDAIGFTRRLEATYRQMWDAWCGKA